MVNFRDILDKMLDVITTFKTACRIKREEKISFFQVLSKIEASITENAFPKNSQNVKPPLYYLSIIQGTKAFIELQMGIFNLNDSRILKNIEHLTLFLRAKDPNRLDKWNSNYLRYIA